MQWNISAIHLHQKLNDALHSLRKIIPETVSISFFITINSNPHKDIWVVYKTILSEGKTKLPT